MLPVLACGLATVDVVQVVEHVPGPDEKVVALATRVEAGGPALNAAVTTSLLGMPCRLVTAVGGSPLGGVVRSECAQFGVDLVDLADAGYELPVATVLVTSTTGERAVASRGALGAATLATALESDVGELLDGIHAVLVDGHHLAVAVPLAAAARARGIPVVADAGSWKPGLDRLLGHVDALVASAAFRPPSGDGLDELLALGPAWVARSAGAGTVRWRGADGTGGQVHPPDIEVVDTLGAGDVLHGALLAEVGRHGTDDLPAALAAAVAVASRSVAASGARGWARAPRGAGVGTR